MKTKPIRNLIIVSDLHCGCQLGLCPPSGVRFDEDGKYHPSSPQRTVWRWWNEFWNEWVPRVTCGEPFDVCINGDAVDGDHHRSTHQISHNGSVQEDIAFQVLKPVREKCRKFYLIRGTEAHVGKSATDEERLARRLDAVPNELGQHARWDLWVEVGKGLVHLLHHIGSTSSSAHESSAVNAELRAEYGESAQWGEQPPDIIVRSHRHRSIRVAIPTRRGEAWAIVTPGWQLKTPFSWKIAGARLAPPQFGGWLIRQGERVLYAEPWTRHISRSKTEV